MWNDHPKGLRRPLRVAPCQNHGHRWHLQSELEPRMHRPGTAARPSGRFGVLHRQTRRIDRLSETGQHPLCRSGRFVGELLARGCCERRVSKML